MLEIFGGALLLVGFLTRPTPSAHPAIWARQHSAARLVARPSESLVCFTAHQERTPFRVPRERYPTSKFKPIRFSSISMSGAMSWALAR